ncbi:MAG TPA: hypothetical protein VG742_05550 [Dongiaceae bacterium]|nr:hypothetical protein [Dongiaceae bacterium]
MANYSTSRPDLRDNGAAAADLMKEKAAKAADAVRESVREGADRVQAEAAEAVDSFRNRVSERPLTALAIGVGIGLLAGLLLRKR